MPSVRNLNSVEQDENQSVEIDADVVRLAIVEQESDHAVEISGDALRSATVEQNEINIVRVSADTVHAATAEVAVINWDSDPYEGATEITPTVETQILATAGKTVMENIRINPIPSNYGLITWNGTTLTVS